MNKLAFSLREKVAGGRMRATTYILHSSRTHVQGTTALNSIPSSWQPQSQLITAADLPRILEQHRVVVVHCGAVWNASDKTMDRTIQEVRGAFEKEVGFYALDIVEEGNRKFCSQHEFMSVPACVCFVNGVFQCTIIGAIPATSVAAHLRTLISAANADDVNANQPSCCTVSLGRGCPCISSRWLTRFPSVNLCVTMRNKHDGDENNMSFSVALDGNEVRENRINACNSMQFKAVQLVVPAQTHGANVAVVGAQDAGHGALSPETAIPDCDALVTNTPGLLLGITIADCLPIFFLDPIHNVIGLAHSGWRGTSRRIAVRTLETMTAHFGTHPAACLIAIGPGIGPDGYEVDERVYNGFAPDDAQAKGVFAPTRPGHWRLDLFAAVTHQLRQAGVPADNIDICPYRTERDTALFFSHRLVPGCGRMGAFLGLRDT